MRSVKRIVIAAGLLAATALAGTAQARDFGIWIGRGHHHDRYYDYDGGYGYRGGNCYAGGCCPRGMTMQSGRCKPYRDY